MKSFIAASTLIALVAAQTNSTGSGSGSGVSPNAKACKDALTLCKSGSNPSSCDAQNDACKATCETAYNKCRSSGDPNLSLCVANYSNCLGELPAGVNGGSGSGSSGSDSTNTTVVTKVVNSYVTYCPGATSFTNNGQVYVATGPTTITVTNCPCTVTSSVAKTTSTAASCPGAGCGSTTGSSGNKTVTMYKGAASSNGVFVAGGLSLAAVLSGVFAFAL